VADELQRKNAAARTLAAAAGLQQGVELEPASRGRRTADRPILLHLPAGSFALLIHGQSGVHELVPNCPFLSAHAKPGVAADATLFVRLAGG
jgi:hypothetical protein